MTTPELMMAQARARISVAFLRKWANYDATGELLRELVAAIIYADLTGTDPAVAITGRQKIRSAMKSDPSIAEVVGADLPLALDAVRTFHRAFQKGLIRAT
jgi:hypothetical protein